MSLFVVCGSAQRDLRAMYRALKNTRDVEHCAALHDEALFYPRRERRAHLQPLAELQHSPLVTEIRTNRSGLVADSFPRSVVI